jgi:hypothetical protein
MGWSKEKKEAHKLRLIEKHGSYEAYKQHMRDLAAFRPSQESIDKMLATREDKGMDSEYFKEFGKLGGRPVKK